MSASDFAPIEARVRDSFSRQTFMTTLGARMSAVRPGEVEIVLPFAEGNKQQHGFVHGGAVASIADSACGYAALTTMPAESAVLAVEFKINFLSPAKGEQLRAHGHVIRTGKKLIVAQSDVFALDGGREKQVAMMTSTVIVLENAGGQQG